MYGLMRAQIHTLISMKEREKTIHRTAYTTPITHGHARKVFGFCLPFKNNQ